MIMTLLIRKNYSSSNNKVDVLKLTEKQKQIFISMEEKKKLHSSTICWKGGWEWFCKTQRQRLTVHLEYKAGYRLKLRLKNQFGRGEVSYTTGTTGGDKVTFESWICF
jgi:hypothetical protein